MFFRFVSLTATPSNSSAFPNMLESVLADILTRVLGQYLEGIDREHVRFGAWSGLVELRTVALRPEALAVLFETLGIALPVSVESGFIGLLRLVVPWKSLGSTPVQVHLHDVTLVAHPVRGDGTDDSQLELRERRIKRARLDTDDAVREASWDVSLQREQKTSSSWSSWLVSDQLKGTILDNIQVNLSNIILRFEDPYSNPNSPYVASMYCESIKILSANSEWQEAFVEHNNSKITRKILEIKGFRVDWAPIVQSETASSSFSDITNTSQRFESPEHLRRYVGTSKTTDSSESSEDPTVPRSLIRRVDGSMRLRLGGADVSAKDVQFELQEPAVDLDIYFPDVFIELNDVQYSCLLQTSLYFARIATRGFRPSTPKARWKWAVDQLLPGCTDRFARACRFTPSGLEKTREQRDTYISLRLSFLKARRTGVEEVSGIRDELECIESATPFEELLAYRDAIDLKAEKYAREWVKIKDAKEKPQETTTSGTTRTSFWSMLGYSDTTEDSNQTPLESDSLEVSMGSDKSLQGPELSESRSNTSESRHHSTLALRAAFLLKKATMRMCQRGYPSIPIPRVELNLRDFQIGVMYSSSKDLVIESLLGSVEAWDLQHNSKMVYNRLSAMTGNTDEESHTDGVHALYPENVREAIESIRSGLNPAKELLLKDGDNGEGDNRDGESGESIFDDLNEPLKDSDSEEPHINIKSHVPRSHSDGSSRGTHKVTEFEFLGNRPDPTADKYVAAVRYTQPSPDVSESSKCPAVLEVSVATLEAIVDGPKGSFLWGLKFWQPKGLVEDPIMAFLGAAAGARIAELRIELEQALLADSVPLEINAVILAPRFIIPSPSKNGPAIVVNMGTLGVCTSDSTPHVQGLTPSVEPKHLRYSNYVLTLDDLGMYFSPDLPTAVSKSLWKTGEVDDISTSLGQMQRDSSSLMSVERIIRPFSLHFVLQTLRDSSVAQVAHSGASQDIASSGSDGMAKIRVRGNIPELSLILTQEAFQHILVSLRIWGDGLKSRGTKRGTATAVPIDKVRPWKEIDDEGLTPVSQQEVIDGVSALANAISAPQGSLVNKTTSEVSPSSVLAAYSVKLVLQTVSIELRENSNSKLVTAMASDLRASVVKKSRSGIEGNLSLCSWSVTDGSRGSTAVFRKLLYSGTVTELESVSPLRGGLGDDAEGVPQQNFVDIHYRLDFNTHEQNVDFRFLSVHANCVRETFLRMVQFFDRVRRHVKQRSRSLRKRAERLRNAEKEESSLENWSVVVPATSNATESQNAFKGGKIAVASKFDGFTCQLVASGGVISTFEMKQSTIHFSRDSSGSQKAWGTFGSFFVRDHTAPIEEYVNVLSYECPGLFAGSDQRDSSKFDSVSNDQKPEWTLDFPVKPNNSYRLSLAFDHIRILYLNRFTELIQDYFLALVNRARPALSSIIEETAAEFEDAERLMSAETYISSSTQFVCSVDFHDFSLRIPRHSSALSEALVFYIAKVHLDNDEKKNLSYWSGQFDGMQGAIQYLLSSTSQNPGEETVTSYFMKDSAAKLKVGPPSEMGTRGLDRKITKLVTVQFPRPLHVNLSEAQYTVLFFVLTENVAETIPDNYVTRTLEGFEQPIGDSSNDLNQGLTMSPGITPQGRTSPAGSAMNLADSTDGLTSTLKMKVEIPALSLEISRGWDVAQRSCRIIGFYLRNVFAETSVSTPRRLVFAFRCKLYSVLDLREEGQSDNRNLVVRLLSGEEQLPEEGIFQEGDGSDENVILSYDKKGTERPAIVASLCQLQINVIPELLRDLSYLAIPGWPFLESSDFPPDYVVVGRVLTLALNESQVTLMPKSSGHDRRALVMTGEVEVKVDWMRNTGAKTIHVSSKHVELSTVSEVPSIIELCDKGYGFKDVCAHPFEKSHAPLIYPTDSSLELVGPDVDEAGHRAHLAVDAALCVLCTSEIPLLRAILKHLSALRPSYLSRRKWKLPVPLSDEGGSSSKEVQKKKARESLNISVEIPVSRFLVTDDKDSRFVPIAEAKLTSLSLSAHASRMVQVTGQLSMDLFNPGKGCWEPAIEPWVVSASMSRGQSGSRAFVIRSNKRLNINIAPNSIMSALAVAKALNEVTDQHPKREAGVAEQAVSKIGEYSSHVPSERPSVAAFLVRNELGIPVHMNLRGERGWKTLAQNSEIEVSAQSEALVSSNAGEKQRSRENVMKCSVSIPGYGAHELSASEPGKFNFTFYPASDPSVSQYNVIGSKGKPVPLDVLWEVVPRKGVPLCTLRSPFRIINATMTKLDVVVTTSSEGQLKRALNSTEQGKTLSPNEWYSVPINDCSGTILLRPAVSSNMPSESSGKLNRPFLWSSPLPKLTWLLTMAQEKKLLDQRVGSNPRKKFENFPLVECKPLHGDGGHCFYFRAIPDTCEANLTTSSSWLDVSIRAPVLLMNKLPGPLSYRIYKTFRCGPSSSLKKEEFGETILAAGVMQGMSDAHVHISSESLASNTLSLAFDNWVEKKSFTGSDLPASFGPCESLQNLISGKVKAIFPQQVPLSSSRGQTKKHLRVSVSPQSDGVCKFKFFAGIWIRNRSDTAIDVCGRPSFYSPGSAPVHLRECLPSDVPDNYVCCEGPFLSIRLSQSDQTESEEFVTHTDWWTTSSGVGDITNPVPISLSGRSLELEIRPSIGIDAPTYIATIRNSSWIINNTSSDLEWCHQTSLDVQGNCPTRLLQLLHPGQCQGLHWNTKSNAKAVHIRLAGGNGQSEWIWSPSIPLDIGFSRELPAKMYRPKTHDQYIARVASKEIAGNARGLVVYDEDRQNPPYRIINLCQERALAFCQTGTKERPWLVRAGKNTRYSWDDPLARPEYRRLSVSILEKGDLEGSSSKVKGGHKQRSQSTRAPASTLNIDEVGDRVMVLSESYNPPVVFNVSVDGATKVLTVFDEGLDPGILEELSSRKSSRKVPPTDKVPIVALDDIEPPEDTVSEQNARKKPTDYPIGEDNQVMTKNVQESEKSGTDAAVFLQSIGISFMEGTPEEFMYMTLSGLLLNFESFRKEQYLALSIEHFQIDNQLTKTSYPVLLWVARNTTKLKDDGEVENRATNAFAVELRRDVTNDDIFMLRNFRACVRPCSISFEDGLVTRVLKFLDDAALVEDGKKTEQLRGIDEEGQTFQSIISSLGGTKPRQKGNTSSSRRIYAHDFKIDATSIRLTSEGSGSTIAKAAGLGSSARAIVGLLLNVENCDFVFADVSVQNVFDSVHHFGVLIRDYYLTQLDSQRFKLLASNSLVGNPAALFDAVGTGARDLLVEPGKAKGSGDFLASIERGSRSFFTHTVGGIADTVSKLPRAVSSGIERAVGDDDYLQERHRIRGSGLASGHRGSTSKNPAQGLATGAISLMHGISSGVTGFIREPVQGAKQGGAGGLLKGIGKAFIGGVAKPVAGAMDFVAEPVAGLSWQMSDCVGANLVTPERPPRAFRGSSARVEEFDWRYSVGVWIMKAVAMASGVTIRGKLINWIELSDRRGRSDEGPEVWVWSIVQKFSRSMPGIKRQVRAELRQHGKGQSSDERLEARPEKTRVALVTDAEVIIVTLDCKLICIIPLWKDAAYEVVGDGKEVILCARILEQPIGGAGESSSHSLYGAQSLIQAPWDVTSGRRRKPTPGESCIDRVACGSNEAQDDLRKLLIQVTDSIRSEQRSEDEAFAKSLMWSEDPSSSEHELSISSQWRGENEVEMREKGLRSIVDASSDSNSQSKADQLELIIRRLSSNNLESETSPEQQGGLRIVIANKIGNGFELRLKSGRLQQGSWKIEAPARLTEWEGAVVEVVGHDRDEAAVDGMEVYGQLEYSVVETDSGSTVIGDVVIAFRKIWDAAAEITASADNGLGAETRDSEDNIATVVIGLTDANAKLQRHPVTGRSIGVESDNSENRNSEVEGQNWANDPGTSEHGLSDQEKSIQQLMDIGFKLEDAVEALSNADGDIVKAVDLLTRHS